MNDREKARNGVQDLAAKVGMSVEAEMRSDSDPGKDSARLKSLRRSEQSVVNFKQAALEISKNKKMTT